MTSRRFQTKQLKTKNKIKGGSSQNNIDLEDRRLSGKELIEQAFNSTING